MNQEWNYKVEAHFPGNSIHNWYFFELKSALHQFSMMAMQHAFIESENSRHFTDPKIINLADESVALSLMEIPIGLALEGSLPTAGWYLFVPDENMKAFQQKADVDFSNAPMYDEE